MKWLAGSFRCSFQGLKDGIFKDCSIRFQFVLGLMALAAGWILRITKEEWLWVLLCIALVISFEFINSCIEKTVDYISLEHNPQAGQIKDMASTAVLIVSLFALIVACLIFIPRLMIWIG